MYSVGRYVLIRNLNNYEAALSTEQAKFSQAATDKDSQISQPVLIHRMIPVRLVFSGSLFDCVTCRQRNARRMSKQQDVDKRAVLLMSIRRTVTE